MKIKFGLFLATLFFSTISFGAEDVTTVEAANSDISDNLDLEAVATIFGESKDLEDFEKKLNDPNTKVSNLDLNEDGDVDYLRVLETSKGNTHLVTIQAVIAKDQYQDVATLDIEKGDDGETQVQVVGDVYMYGPNYVVTPVYTHPPVIFTFFFTAALYHAWHSPYYWGFYPSFYHPWRPFPVYGYHRHVDVNINIHNNHFNHTTIRNSNTAIGLQNKSRRNDFGKKHPDKSFSKRNAGVSNKRALDQGRTKTRTEKPSLPKNKASTGKVEKTSLPKDKVSTGKNVQKNWKPKSELTGNKSKVKNNKVSVPSRPKYKSTGSKDHALKGAGNGRQSSRNFNRGSSSMRSAGGNRAGGGHRGRR